MAETLKEIVAREMLDVMASEVDERWYAGKLMSDEVLLKIATAVISALRNPPPETIEAGARAMYEAVAPPCVWDATSKRTADRWRKMWFASWRAAIDAK